MRFLTLILLLTVVSAAHATDACSMRAIGTSADVSVTDGSSFTIESYFRSRDYAAIRHFGEKERVTSVEGPFGWIGSGDKFRLGGDFEKIFALGHQFHAFILYFDELTDDQRDSADIEFLGAPHAARSGDYPYGGDVHLIAGDDPARPIGIVFNFPDIDPLEVALHDWREVDGVELPFELAIHDRGKVFRYRYTSVDLSPQTELWLFDAIGEPAPDEVQALRLHRKLLAAHCLGDAEMMAALSNETIISADKGRRAERDNNAMRERFTGLFKMLNYTEYHDLQQPVVEIAASGDLGWVIVNVRSVGKQLSNNQAFDYEWAWVMLVRKVDGRWLYTGGASSVLRE
jgi:ketosteroid isomerase-like protein